MKLKCGLGKTTKNAFSFLRLKTAATQVDKPYLLGHIWTCSCNWYKALGSVAACIWNLTYSAINKWNNFTVLGWKYPPLLKKKPKWSSASCISDTLWELDLMTSPEVNIYRSHFLDTLWHGKTLKVYCQVYAWGAEHSTYTIKHRHCPTSSSPVHKKICQVERLLSGWGVELTPALVCLPAWRMRWPL